MVYDGGLKATSEDGRSEVKICARLQPRLVVRVPDGDPTTVAFVPRRIRLKVKGRLLGESLGLYLQTGWDRGEPALIDAYADARLSGPVHLRVGQMKVPFTRDFIMASADVAMTERAIHHSALGLDRDVGLLLHDDFESTTGFEMALGVFDGGGPASRERGPWAPRVMGRVGYSTDGSDPYTQIAETYGVGAAIDVAAEARFDGVRSDEDLPEDIDPYVQLGVDGLIRLGAVSLQSALVYRSVAENGVEPLDLLTGHVDAHVLIDEVHVPAIRYARVMPVSLSQAPRSELTIGYAYLADGNRVKWTTDAGVRTAGQLSLLFRTQLEANF